MREPRKGDAPALLRFINDLAVEPMSGILVNGKLTLKEEEAYLKGLLIDVRKRAVAVLLVEHDGRIVGNCSISRLRWKMRHRALLAIALSRDYREVGIGKELARRVMALAVETMEGIEVIELSYLAYNKRAKSFYTKLGFMSESVIRASVKECDRYYDEQRMVLKLVQGKGGRASLPSKARPSG
ncbi:MAG: GNAT family N-acetyltransferase [Thermoplasmata archaeon]|nr:GNAT family N-acetyltransferase [Thermoplasmata archaeon]